MKALIKIKQSPIMDRKHVEERDDKTNYRTQTEVCGYRRVRQGSADRIYSGICKSEEGKYNSSFAREWSSGCQNLKPVKSKWIPSRNGNNFKACRNNTKTTKSIDLVLDNSTETIAYSTSYNLGGAA